MTTWNPTEPVLVPDAQPFDDYPIVGLEVEVVARLIDSDGCLLAEVRIPSPAGASYDPRIALQEQLVGAVTAPTVDAAEALSSLAALAVFGR